MSQYIGGRFQPNSRKPETNGARLKAFFKRVREEQLRQLVDDRVDLEELARRGFMGEDWPDDGPRY